MIYDLATEKRNTVSLKLSLSGFHPMNVLQSYLHLVLLGHGEHEAAGQLSWPEQILLGSLVSNSRINQQLYRCRPHLRLIQACFLPFMGAPYFGAGNSGATSLLRALTVADHSAGSKS